MSFTKIAHRIPSRLRRIWDSKVVFPDPKNPDKSVTGSLESFFPDSSNFIFNDFSSDFAASGCFKISGFFAGGSFSLLQLTLPVAFLLFPVMDSFLTIAFVLRVVGAMIHLSNLARALGVETALGRHRNYRLSCCANFSLRNSLTGQLEFAATGRTRLSGPRTGCGARRLSGPPAIRPAGPRLH